ncbi:GGDEF domain-containing protein [Thiobacter aerophilum]|uniref:GGDEF domain-containing protein n=1 Tax=Thiobacter aerophilum TaxID=3121275 RepID=A0ABV0EHD8_9BURK
MPGRPSLRLILVAAFLVVAWVPLMLLPLGWPLALGVATTLALLCGLALAHYLTRATARLRTTIERLPDSGFRSAFSPLPRCAPREWETLQRAIADSARDTAKRLAEREARIDELARQLAEATRNLEQANQALAARAFLDELTHLPNRRALWRRLMELERAHPASYLPVQVLLFRLKGRNAIQARHGPDVADAVRAEVARRIQAASRAGEFVARYDEDEFVLLLWRCPATLAQERAKTLGEAVIASPLWVAGQPIEPGIDVTCAQCNDRLSRPAFVRLLKLAGEAANPWSGELSTGPSGAF